MRKILIIIIIIAVIIAGVVIYSVSNKANEETLKKISVNEVTRSVFYAPQYVAINKGFFEEEGLEIELTTGQGADKVMTAVLAGQSDIGLLDQRLQYMSITKVKKITQKYLHR